MPEEEFLTLTKGSRYRVVSVETRDKAMVSHGVFRGFASIGPDEALSMELDDSHQGQSGKTRLIPIHMILAVDIVDQVREKEKVRPPEKMFG